MEPEYATIIDRATMVPTMGAYAIHAASVVIQTVLAIFLIGMGAYGSLGPRANGRIFLRLGATHVAESQARRDGWLTLACGALLLAPIAIGAPGVLSLAGAVGAGLLFWLRGRTLVGPARKTGRPMRRLVATLAALLAAFIAWEREDPIVLGTELAGQFAEYSAKGAQWQIERDRTAPKVGDLAPDFELRDPSGSRLVRLSDFRGEKPVALAFGSYT